MLHSNLWPSIPSELRSLLSKHGLKFVFKDTSLHPNATYFSRFSMILCDHDQMIFMLANCVTLVNLSDCTVTANSQI